jgi:hypothetical protein
MDQTTISLVTSMNTDQTTISHLTSINPDQIVYGSPGHGFDNAQKCGGVKPMDGIPTILDNWISSSNADKTKNEQIRFHSHRPLTL